MCRKNPWDLKMLVFKFHQNRRQFFFLLRKVPPLDFTVCYLKSGFLAIESLQLQWQMVFLINSECPNIIWVGKIDKHHGIFCLGCLTLQHAVYLHFTSWHVHIFMTKKYTLTKFLLNYFSESSIYITFFLCSFVVKTWLILSSSLSQI